MSIRLGKIYKIVCGLTEDIYIGSTFNELKHRFQQHKNNYGKWLKGKNVTKITIFDLFKTYDVKNFRIILIKEYEVCDRLHLQAYEQLYINRSKSCVNRCNPFKIKWLYDKNYRINNSEKIKQNVKEYSIKNKEKIQEYRKQYRVDNRKKLDENNKIYRSNNIEKFKEYQKKYGKEWSAQQITCECGVILNRSSLRLHLKSKKHISFCSIKTHHKAPFGI